MFGVATSHAAVNLADLYEQAVKSDPKLSISRSSLASSGASEKIARAGLLPTISLNSSVKYTDTNVRGSISGARDDSYSSQSAVLNFSQPIYRKDRSISYDKSKVATEKAEADYEVAEDDLIIRLVQAYFDVLSAQDALEFVFADKKAIDRQLEQARQRYEAGLIAITAVYEAQAAYDQSLSTEVIAENSLDNAWEALKEIIGEQEIKKLRRLRENLQFEKPTPGDINEWTDLAVANNPQILSTLKDMEIARKEIKLKKTGHYPTVDLVASYGITRTGARTDNDNDVATIGVEVEVPLYSGGSVDASVLKASYDYNAAVQNLEQQKRSITRQVKNAYRGVMASIASIKALKATTVSSRSALEATEAGFDVGTRTIVDVLNSSRNLYSALNDLSKARYDYIVNMMLLKQASGQLQVADIATVNQWLD